MHVNTAGPGNGWWALAAPTQRAADRVMPNGSTLAFDRTVDEATGDRSNTATLTLPSGKVVTREASFVKTENGFQHDATTTFANGATRTHQQIFDRTTHTMDLERTMLREDGSGRVRSMSLAPDPDGNGTIITRTVDLIDATTLKGLLPVEDPAPDGTMAPAEPTDVPALVA